MAVEVALVGIQIGVRTVTAKAYEASWHQAAVYSSVNEIALIILKGLVISYVQNTRQSVFADIAIHVIAGLAGVLMTRFLCKETIHWKPALASSVFSITAFRCVCPLFMKPEPLAEVFG